MFIGNLIAHLIAVVSLLVWTIGGGIFVRRIVKTSQNKNNNYVGNIGTKYQDRY